MLKPVDFEDSNVEFAKDQDEYGSLSALRFDSIEGEVITCWKMSFRDRFKVLFTGVIWMRLLTFNRPLTPSNLSVNRKDMYSRPEDKIKDF